ncbi:MAG: hypothetical protein EXQ52_04885 [Bryobacterales bacterium]|nr:hypothetical protein [Bryobacterales bacterium]
MNRRGFLALPLLAAAPGRPLSIATFQTDVTPPLGSPLGLGTVDRAAALDDPLSARGIVFFVPPAPIVLCAVDWIGISNQGHDQWCAALAKAAGTTPERVSVHTLHQHDAPGYDPGAEEIAATQDLTGELFDPKFAAEAMRRTAAAVAQAVSQPRSVTHLGIGQAKVEQVASNRRVLGPDGTVKYARMSATRSAEARAQPEGTIDPFVRLLSLWNLDRPLVSLTYYATHPQSYYGKGGISADFVGAARGLRESALPGVSHIHFNGAGGNVAAGKYNDGAHENRAILAARLAAGMKSAWDATVRTPVTASAIEWRSKAVSLPLGERFSDASLRSTLVDAKLPVRERLRAARDLSWTRRQAAGRQVRLHCLRIGDARVLHMAGELFVEYQLAAQRMIPANVVAMAAYGDFGPGYIGTDIAYSQGGYETGIVSRVKPGVEGVLMDAMRELLR